MTPHHPTTGPGPSQPDLPEEPQGDLPDDLQGGEQHAGQADPDPTGVRVLLQGLPDPGPMPADLVARIESRLAAEQEHRQVGLPTPDAPVSRSHELAPQPVDLDAERNRRRSGRPLVWLGAAAAGLMVTTVALSQVFDGSSLSGGTAAYAPASSAARDAEQSTPEQAGQVQDQPAQDGSEQDGASSGSAEDSLADGGQAGGGQGPAADSDEAGAMAAPGTGIQVLPALGEVEEQFAVQLRDAATRPSEESLPEAMSLTVAQADSCWASLAPQGEQQTWDQRLAASGTRAGEPVVVLLGLGQGEDGHAWMLPWSCTSGAAMVLEDLPLAP